MKKEKIYTIMFCIFITVLIILFSYKIALGTTDLTKNQQVTMDFLDNKAELELNYTANEVSHLEDVKQVMKGTDYLFYLSLVIVSFIITYYKKRRDVIKKLFYYGGITSLAVSGLMLIFSLLSFNSTFTIFHKIFFPQGNWTFPIDSLLIQTFPIDFFVTISSKIMVIAVVIAAGMIFISKRMKHVD